MHQFASNATRLLWLLTVLGMCGLVCAEDIGDEEEAASYFQGFFAQTEDWGDFDVQIQWSTLTEELGTAKLSQFVVQERYVNTHSVKILVRSLRIAPIAGEELLQPTHRLTVTILSPAKDVALQRDYPLRTIDFDIRGEGRTFEWVCNPPDFRLVGVIAFPFQGGAIAEETVQAQRKQRLAAYKPISLVVRDGQAIITKTLEKSLGSQTANGQFSSVFDVNRLLMLGRKYRMQAGARGHSLKEDFYWEKIDRKFRLTRLIGESERSVSDDDGEFTQQVEQFEAKFKWNKIDIEAMGDPNDLLNDFDKAMDFVDFEKVRPIELKPDPENES